MELIWIFFSKNGMLPDLRLLVLPQCTNKVNRIVPPEVRIDSQTDVKNTGLTQRLFEGCSTHRHPSFIGPIWNHPPARKRSSFLAKRCDRLCAGTFDDTTTFRGVGRASPRHDAIGIGVRKFRTGPLAGDLCLGDRSICRSAPDTFFRRYSRLLLDRTGQLSLLATKSETTQRISFDGGCPARHDLTNDSHR